MPVIIDTMGRNYEARRRRPRRPGAGDETATVHLEDLTRLPREEAAALLARAEYDGYEVMPAGSNYTFIAVMSAAGHGQFLSIYKPRRGETPLWDFPDGTLYRREHAAYVVSRHLGWPNIPVTIIREGPFGIGMAQVFVPTPDRWDFETLQRNHSRQLMQIALFDVLTNNADRKAGHCLLGTDGQIWAIDHGLTFSAEPKLRTVLWDYAGEPVPDHLLVDLRCIQDDPARGQRLRSELEADLDAAEIELFFRRLERVLRTGRFPSPAPGHRNVPWPFI
jgi:uncharacterized repeat protein (TIGR03843 family)